MSAPGKDWFDWHKPYDDPDSALSVRLSIVQRRLREALDGRGSTATTVISMCAGQGRDLIPVLAERVPAAGVVARLVDTDASNAAVAQQAIREAHLENVEVVLGDAAYVDAYTGFVPADLVLVCGVFGNISNDDIAHTIRCLPQLCAPGAVVLWTRHRKEPDLTPTIQTWLGESGFVELSFDAPDGFVFGVGTNRFAGTPQPLEPQTRLFDFVGPDRARAASRTSSYAARAVQTQPRS